VRSLSQRMPKTFKPMITTIGTPQSQRMMLFMEVSGVLVRMSLGGPGPDAASQCNPPASAGAYMAAPWRAGQRMRPHPRPF